MINGKCNIGFFTNDCLELLRVLGVRAQIINQHDGTKMVRVAYYDLNDVREAIDYATKEMGSDYEFRIEPNLSWWECWWPRVRISYMSSFRSQFGSRVDRAIHWIDARNARKRDLLISRALGR